MFASRKKSRHVVVAFASADRAAALDVVRELEAGGALLWVAARDADPGRGLAEQMRDAIDDGAALLLIVSRAANESKLLRTEAEIALDRAPIIPVRIEDVLPTQALRATVQGQPSFDLFGDARAAELERLLAAIRVLQGAPRRPARPDPVPQAGPDDAPGTPATADAGRDADLAAFGRTAALRTYVGPRADAILERWRDAEPRRGLPAPFLPGLLLGRYWLAYRKLAWPALACSAIFLLLAALALWADSRGTLPGITIAAVAGGGILLLGLWASLYGLDLYRARAERVIGRVHAAVPDEAEAHDRVARQGGTDWFRPALLAAGEIVALVLLTYAIDTGRIAWLIGLRPPPPQESFDIVDMTPRAEAGTRRAFCIVNPTAFRIRFSLRYGASAEQAHVLEPNSRSYTFASSRPEPPTILFDHLPREGAGRSPRSYGLDTGAASPADACGGTVYFFATDGRELDLRLRQEDPDGLPPA